jgi:3-oxoacyl-[acyl-carrier protein] reductase
MIDLAGKVVLVTGGARGIGAAIVRGMAAAGAGVVFTYRSDAKRAERMVLELGEDRCLCLRADFMVDEDIHSAWKRTVAWRGGIDVLVNNAGVFEPAAVDNGDDAWHGAWDRALRINLVAAAELCRQAVRHFRERGGGIIINIASRAAFRGDDPDYMHYAASKGGMVALTRSLARGFATDKVLAYVLAPGFVRTEMAEDYVRRHGEDRILREIPLGEMAAPEDVSDIAVYLATGRARHATGTVIDINGASYVR